MKYIVAVSGGVDSVALLHMLVHHSPHELMVAHFDHGIRPDSDSDVWHVASLARQYNLPFLSSRVSLGEGASEERARQARYDWLKSIQQEHQADGIITAHHQDDILETLTFNIQRGTGWRGIASLRSTETMYRPLLTISKVQLVAYALHHGLIWREDSTNEDTRYTRNYIRHVIMPRLTPEKRNILLELAKKQHTIRLQIENEIAGVIQRLRDEAGYSRYQLIMSPENVALEVLRMATNDACEPAQLRRLLHFIKTGRQGAVMQIGAGKNALLTTRHVLL